MNKRPDPTRRVAPASPPQDRLQRGIAAFTAGQDADAERLLKKVVERTPNQPQALLILGILSARRGRLAESERHLRACLASDPGNADAHNNLGNLLLAQGRLAEAELSYLRCLESAPTYHLAHYNLGNCHKASGRFADAERDYRRALQIAPDFIGAWVNLGNLYREAGAYGQAEEIYRHLLARVPTLHEIRLNLGNVQRQRGDLSQARATYTSLLRAVPDHPRAKLSLALTCLAEHALGEAGRLIEEAAASAQAPAHEVLTARAAYHARVGDQEAALAAVTSAVAAGGDSPEHMVLIATLLAEFGQRPRAIETLERSRARFGDRPRGLLGLLVSNRQKLCDWRYWDAELGELTGRIRDQGEGEDVIGPFEALSIPGLAPADLARIARARSERYRSWIAAGPLWRAPSPGGRLRVGYLSADFREHAMGYMTAPLFACHDRERVEVFAYSLARPVADPLRERFRATAEHFVELHDLDHRAAARRIADDGIDILVDLQGHTRHCRPEILALRPAPVQVGWLGYPGTLGLETLDYILVDQHVVPPEQATNYSESLAYLPGCYLAIDFTDPAGKPTNRAEAGLPEDAFVFCCFNNHYKLTPDYFDCWCALLEQVPGSVLWLYATSDEVAANLRREASARGVDPGRLVFAARVPHQDHLVRLALADLFLDTGPYSAGATAAGALWAGLPVLTCPGASYPSRFAASLSTAAGVPELICADLQEYRARALGLARDPASLAAIRARLVAARETSPLFDYPAFTRRLEDLLTTMRDRQRAGLAPVRLAPAETHAPT